MGITRTAGGESLEANGGDISAQELEQVANVSDRLITASDSTLTVTQALHGEHTVLLDRAAGIAVTLPAASGSGARYKFVITTTITSNTTTIKAASASDSFVGMAFGVDTDAEGASGYTWNADTNDDTFTMDGSAQGGIAGDVVEVEDIASGTFLVRGFITQSGGSEATPFSATVS